MKTLTNMMVAATLAFGATAANADMDISNTKSSEAFLSVYDPVSKQTFTLDLGIAGVTAGNLFDNLHNPDYNVNIDLSQFADWNTFVSKADLDKTYYAVGVAGKWGFIPHVFLTGTDTTFFKGKEFNSIDQLGVRVRLHKNNINADTNSFNNYAVNETTLVEDGDGHMGHHEEGAGSRELWGGASYDINGFYGDANGIDFTMSYVDVSDLTNIHGDQKVAAFKVYLTGNTFEMKAPAAVPVPAAVWLFGSALLGLGGFSRRVKKA